MAKKKATVQVRLDGTLKDRAEKVFHAVGIDMPTAIRMFFTKVALTGGIPFRLHENLPDSAFFTDEDMEEAYQESLDPKNVSGPFDSVEAMFVDLDSHLKE